MVYMYSSMIFSVFIILKIDENCRFKNQAPLWQAAAPLCTWWPLLIAEERHAMLNKNLQFLLSYYLIYI